MPKFSTPMVDRTVMADRVPPQNRIAGFFVKKSQSHGSRVRRPAQVMTAREKKLYYRLPLVVLGAGIFEALYLFIAQHMTISDVIRWFEDQVSRVMG